jgi:rRNA maturation RNase YbeY
VPIKFYNSNIPFRLRNKRKIVSWIERVVSNHGYIVENISIIFCTEEEIIRINNQYLNHNYFTDIITFPYSKDKNISADLFISIPTVRDNAKVFNQLFSVELNRVIIHGVLHLIGYDDKTVKMKKKIREVEDQCLKLFN